MEALVWLAPRRMFQSSCRVGPYEFAETPPHPLPSPRERGEGEVVRCSNLTHDALEAASVGGLFHSTPR
jgi:hypothetical protein